MSSEHAAGGWRSHFCLNGQAAPSETLMVVRRVVVDLNWGGRFADGRGITYLARGERRNGELPADLAPGQEILLADYDGFPDGFPAWIEIPARVLAEDDGWSAIWNRDDRRWVTRR